MIYKKVTRCKRILLQAYLQLSWQRSGNHSTIRPESIFCDVRVTTQLQHCVLRVTHKLKYYSKLFLLQSVAWNLTAVSTVLVCIYRSWLYSSYHSVKQHSHHCQKRSNYQSTHRWKSKRGPEYYSCSHYSSALRTSQQPPLQQSTETSTWQ